MKYGTLSGSNEITLVGHRARLNESISYWTPTGTIFHVEAGFIFDGASIPDFAWSIVGHPYMPGYRRPSAVHDYLMRYQTVPSHEAHRYFYYCLLLEGVSRWRALTLYNSVRLFGPRF